MEIGARNEPLTVYWQPGCTGCLKMKEFLTEHGISFISVNVLQDPAALDELAKLGVRRVPIAVRGNQWVDGQVLADLARLAGIRWNVPRQLPPSELVARANMFLSTTQRFLQQIPERDLSSLLPKRPRTYRQLICHIFQNIDAFLDLAEHGQRLEQAALMQEVPPNVVTREQLASFGHITQLRMNGWWKRQGTTTNFSAKADVYYGEQTLHQFLERTVWHSGQHVRQLQLVIESLGLQPDGPLTGADLAGLPMPQNVWDDQLQFDHDVAA